MTPVFTAIGLLGQLAVPPAWWCVAPALPLFAPAKWAGLVGAWMDAWVRTTIPAPLFLFPLCRLTAGPLVPFTICVFKFVGFPQAALKVSSSSHSSPRHPLLSARLSRRASRTVHQSSRQHLVTSLLISPSTNHRFFDKLALRTPTTKTLLLPTSNMPPPRARWTVVTVWFCHCSHDGQYWLVDTTPACLNCNHYRCRDCRVATAQVRVGR